jgi:hypothetical protein
MPNKFVDKDDMPNYRDMLQELLDLDEGLTDWELNFCERLFRLPLPWPLYWHDEFTVKQAARLEQIYDKRM